MKNTSDRSIAAPVRLEKGGGMKSLPIVDLVDYFKREAAEAVIIDSVSGLTWGRFDGSRLLHGPRCASSLSARRGPTPPPGKPFAFRLDQWLSGRP
jgi:hypothetical protein